MPSSSPRPHHFTGALQPPGTGLSEETHSGPPYESGLPRQALKSLADLRKLIGGVVPAGPQEGKEVEVSGPVHSQVYITVLDENDNSPRFDFTSDSAISVPEDCAVGQRVATVKARDPDAGSNAGRWVPVK